MQRTELSDQPIKLDAAAAAQLKLALAERPCSCGLRLSIERASCAGFTYRLEYVDKPTTEQAWMTVDGIDWFVTPSIRRFVNNIWIELQSDGFSEQLVIRNLNTKKSCSCGKTFALE